MENSRFVVLAAQRAETEKRSQVIDSQVAFILPQADQGMPVEDLCRRAGIRQAIYNNWCKTYGGSMPSERKRLMQLEEGTNNLKPLVGDLLLDRAMLQDVSPRRTVRPAVQRQLGNALHRVWQVSIRLT